MTFTRSTDYRAIHELLSQPECLRRMTGLPMPESVGPQPGTDYVLVEQEKKNVAVFVILNGLELHFCFCKEVWGRTLEIAQAFLEWAWKNYDTSVFIGPVPKRNRLAVKLAKRCGFKESHYTDRDELVYLYCERPQAA